MPLPSPAQIRSSSVGVLKGKTEDMINTLTQLRNALEQAQANITQLLQIETLSVYANNAAALAGGLQAGEFYRTGGDPDLVAVVH